MHTAISSTNKDVKTESPANDVIEVSRKVYMRRIVLNLHGNSESNNLILYDISKR